MTRRPTNTKGNLSRAKRLFARNVALFIALMAIGCFLLSGDSEDEEIEATPPAPAAETPLSLPEQAYLKGQVDALDEHPESMPAFAEDWVRAISIKTIRRDTDFADLPEATIEILADEYYRGYAERFDEYFDTATARELGYAHGLRFDPSIHGFVSKATIREDLAKNESALRERYGLDSAKWLLFVKAFDEGFKAGYFVTREEITARVGESITMEF